MHHPKKHRIFIFYPEINWRRINLKKGATAPLNTNKIQWLPQFLAEQLTLFQPGGRLCPPHYYCLPPPSHIFGWCAAQRAKFAEKVKKPPLGIIVINFELNGFNASLCVPWSPSEYKKL